MDKFFIQTDNVIYAKIANFRISPPPPVFKCNLSMRVCIVILFIIFVIYRVLLFNIHF